jgi:bifunctional non-homologous end joining protein LigD
VVDGEIVAFDGRLTSFARLQQRMQLTDPDQARASGVAVLYYLIDLVHLEGHDLTGLSLRTRKALLRRSLHYDYAIRFPPHRNRCAEDYLRAACAKGWEGLIAKRASGAYRHERSSDWLKFKCMRGQELVIGGFTAPKRSRKGFGALLLGYYDDGACATPARSAPVSMTGRSSICVGGSTKWRAPSRPMRTRFSNRA